MRVISFSDRAFRIGTLKFATSYTNHIHAYYSFTLWLCHHASKHPDISTDLLAAIWVLESKSRVIIQCCFHSYSAHLISNSHSLLKKMLKRTDWHLWWMQQTWRSTSSKHIKAWLRQDHLRSVSGCCSGSHFPNSVLSQYTKAKTNTFVFSYFCVQDYHKVTKKKEFVVNVHGFFFEQMCTAL